MRVGFVVSLGLTFAVLSCHRPPRDAQAPAPEERRAQLSVSEEDVRILERADAILSGQDVWNRADTRECPEDAVRFSLFCALQKATIEVIGNYDHRRLALQQTRVVIEERGKEYEHRLMGFNNDPATTFSDIKQVLASARERVSGPSVVQRAAGASMTVGAGQGRAALRHFPRALNLEETSETSANVSMGDLDGDGDIDLVLAKGRHWPLIDRVLLNNGKGEFVASDLGPTADRSYSALLSDLDGNGTLDLVISNDEPDSKLIYLNDGKAHFRRASTWGAANWSTRAAAVADLNGDGRPDVIAANRGGPSYVCLNDGAGRFDTQPCIAVAAESATKIVTGDFNNDGAIDLAVPHRDGGQSRLFLNDGKAGFAKTVAFGPAVTNARAAAAGDVNGDGWLDLVVGDEKTGTRVYLNDGHGALVDGVPLGEATPAPGAIAIADMNLDGRADVVVGHVEAPGKVWFNDGSGRRFTPVPFGDARGAVYGLALGDLDGDGYPDIAVARSDAPNVMFSSVR